MWPKFLKPNWNWLVAAVWLAVVASAYWAFFDPYKAKLPLDHHKQVDFGVIQQLVEKYPGQVKTITFLKERRRDTPVKVMTDGEQSLWAEMIGTHDYELLSDAAEHNHVAKDARFLNPQEEHMGGTGGPDFAWFAGNVILPLVFMIGTFFLFNKAGSFLGGNANKTSKISLTRLDQKENPVKFTDVAGIEDELKKVKSLVFDIRNPSMLTRLGGKLPVGMQIVGPPGTGKTFIVQAIAGEAGIPVLSMSGSDFNEMFVGVGAARMRDAWAQARALRDAENKWVILFCDEFDSVGRSRADGGGGNDERNQTVGQILVEIQGTQSDNSRILFVIATNQPDSLDPAIVRAGRLGDMKLEVVAPDKEGRQAIMRVKLRKIPAGDDINVELLAEEMPGLTGADIDTLVTKRGPQFAKKRLLERVPKDIAWEPGKLKLEDYFKPEDFKVTHIDLWKALEDMTIGSVNETKGRRLNPEVRRMIAFHELGHFTLAMRKRLQHTGQWDGQYGDAISSISILGPNGVGGFVKTVPDHDMKTAKNYKGFVAIALAGNRAERMFLNDKTGGCSNDLEQASRIVKAMLLQLNMSDCNNQGWKLPAISVEYSGGSRYLGGQEMHEAQYGMSEDSAKQVDKFINLFLTEAEVEADSYLAEEAEWIRWMAPTLMTRERMRFKEIEAYWNEFHKGKDLTRAVAFPYNWDRNHKLLEAKVVDLCRGPA
jgi:cell division protease FtsH